MVHREDCHAMLLRREICFKTCLQNKYFCHCQTIENCKVQKESLQNRITKARANKCSPYHTESKIRKQRHFDQV